MGSMKVTHLFAVGLLATLAGCASTTERFTPTERASSISPTGFLAAQYDVILEGSVVGEAELWSAGAFKDKAKGYDRTLVHVGMRIENNGEVPLQIPTDALSFNSPNVLTESDLAVTELEGDTVVRPGEESVVNLFFEMPPGLKPQTMDAFQLRWKLTSSQGEYVQNTPFAEAEPQPGYAYYGTYGTALYYNPFFSSFTYYPGPYLSWGYTYRPRYVQPYYVRPYSVRPYYGRPYAYPRHDYPPRHVRPRRRHR